MGMKKLYILCAFFHLFSDFQSFILFLVFFNHIVFLSPLGIHVCVLPITGFFYYNKDKEKDLVTYTYFDTIIVLFILV